MGRPFARAALGGVSDESEIRGFRRTYVGSMPGIFIQKMRQVGVNNPVILLDEIDKLATGNSSRGDPSAAMLEVLDPEQNNSFTDHYINTPVDLSSVLFIATANTLDTIPPPLLDRMEIIHLSGYVDVEKLQIARKYLLPKQLKANSLQPQHLKIDDDTILAIVNRYCHESGVRTLERQIGSVCRWKAVELARARDRLSSDTAMTQPVGTLDITGYDPIVKIGDLESILGHHHMQDDELEAVGRPGAAVGLGYTGSGTGSILHIEATSMPGKGELVGYLFPPLHATALQQFFHLSVRLLIQLFYSHKQRLTGSLGDVIKESAGIALSWVRANAFNLGLAERDENILDGIDIHLHVSIPKPVLHTSEFHLVLIPEYSASSCL
jgi:ATP-dependent Lon protease